MTRNCSWRVRPFVKRIQREYGRHPSDVIGMLRVAGVGWIEIARRLHCSQSTIHRYIRADDLGYCCLSDAGRESKRENARRLNARMAAGEVERGGFAKIRLGMVSPLGPDSGSRL